MMFFSMFFMDRAENSPVTQHLEEKTVTVFAVIETSKGALKGNILCMWLLWWKAFCETLEEANHRLQRELVEKHQEIESLKKLLEEKDFKISFLEKAT